MKVKHNAPIMYCDFYKPYSKDGFAVSLEEIRLAAMKQSMTNKLRKIPSPTQNGGGQGHI